MIFTPTNIHSAWLLDPKRIEDARGFFARSFCVKELQEHGIHSSIQQINLGFSAQGGTLRGLHYQLAPHQEVKVVRCTRGSVFDIVLDLRPDSPTFKQWIGHELTAENRRILVVPEGCAHGYQTLEDNSEVEYSTTASFAPDAARGVRYNDPAFGVEWPLPVTAISDADRTWPDFRIDMVELFSPGGGNGHR